MKLNAENNSPITYQTFSLTSFEQRQYQSVLETQALSHIPYDGGQKKQASDKLTVQSTIDTKQSRAVSMLNYWWQQATVQERAEFLKQHQQ